MEEEKYIALVDENDQIISYEEKMLVHKKGLLHRAFSIFIFNSKGEMLIQQRAYQKYHSGGLWTNACCSHLTKDEIFEDAMHERLQKEMGFDCPLEFAFSFHYKVQFKNNLIENELDHVYIGNFDGIPQPNPTEAAAYKWISVDEIKRDLVENEEIYTYWFKIAFEKLFKISRHPTS